MNCNNTLSKDFSELQPGAFGILEPQAHPSWFASPEQFDLVLVPGLAFDRAGHRLGAGKGYYDRLKFKILGPPLKFCHIDAINRIEFDAFFH